MKKQPTLGEFDLIERYLRPLATAPGALALRDDAATLSLPPDEDLVISKDMLLSDVHFFADDPPDLIARKALRENISDLVSKGAKPLHYALGLAFPDPPKPAFMQAFCNGLKTDQDTYGLSLIGGDTTRSHGQFVISITAFGTVPKGRSVTRLNANPGDLLYVTGTLGDGALGLMTRRDRSFFSGCEDWAIDDLHSVFLLPKPPFDMIDLIRDHATASMDISDGLFADVAHMCRASGVSAVIEETDIPLSAAASHVIGINPDLRAVALKGGDDYQTLMAVSPEQEVNLLKRSAERECRITRIGRLETNGALPVQRLHRGDPVEGQLSGHTHF